MEKKRKTHPPTERNPLHSPSLGHYQLFPNQNTCSPQSNLLNVEQEKNLSKQNPNSKNNPKVNRTQALHEKTPETLKFT